MLQGVLNLFRPDPRLQGGKRSPQWRKVRDGFLIGKKCAACGGTKNLVAHHCKPFHLFPGYELDLDNLLCLCEHPVVNCHLLFGHLGSWKSWNYDVRIDAARMLGKINLRP